MRVAVTTTADATERIATPLRERGLQPVSLPCITIQPSSDADLARLREAAEGADLVLVTSPRAVRITWPDGGMPPVPAACVGPATAAAVTAAGGQVELVGEGGAAALADLVAERVEGKRVVFPHARAADPATAARLRDAGAEVTAVPAYDTLPIAPDPDPVDAAVFGSPSAVEGWCLARSLEGLVLAVMGPVTARALADRGHPADVVPDRPGVAELIDALHIAVAERS